MTVRHVFGLLLVAGALVLSACGDDNVAGAGPSAPASTLSAPITANAVAIALVDASSFPTAGRILIGGTEEATYNGKNGNTLLNVDRGEGATDHNQGSAVKLLEELPPFTATRTATKTHTATFTSSNTPTITNTATNTLSPTITGTPTNTPLVSSTPTDTVPPASSPTPTMTSGSGAACGNNVVESGELCDNGSACVAGPQVPSAPVTCTGDGDCAGGQKCGPARPRACYVPCVEGVNPNADDTDCGTGGVCIDAGCVAGSKVPATRATCTSDGDCGSGQKCGAPEVRTCYAPCTKDSDCGAGGQCNPVGGDGCAANCTTETLRPMPFKFAQQDENEKFIGGSFAIAQTAAFPVPLPLRGAFAFTTGSARSQDTVQTDGRVVVPANDVPVVIRTADVKIKKVPSSGTVCACLRGFEEGTFGPGNAASGTISCAAGGLDGTDFVFIKDHKLGVVGVNGFTSQDCTNADGFVEDGSAVHKHTGLCNGPDDITATGHGPQGSSVMGLSVGIALLQDGGTCFVNDGFAVKGPDGIPCTNDDLDMGNQAVVPLTTSYGRAEVRHATAGSKNIAKGAGTPCANDTQCTNGDKCANTETLTGCGGAAGCECRTKCGSVFCDTEVTGKPFVCSAMDANPNGGLTGGEISSSFSFIDIINTDVVVRITLAAQ